MHLTALGSMAISNVSIIDAAMPGTLTTVNMFCVEQAVKTALAINATINLRYSFDRNNSIFFTDLPKGYQISLYNPIALNGGIEIEAEDVTSRIIKIARLHM